MISSQKAAQNQSPHTAIVGAGTSALRFLVVMLREGRLNEMLKGGGFIIMDSDLNFGGGHQDKQVVRSTTPALEVTRIILKDPYYRQQDVFDSLRCEYSRNADSNTTSLAQSNVKKTSAQLLASIPQISSKKALEFFDVATMGPFREVLSTATFAELLKYGNDTPPASLEAYFLRLVGNTLLRYIHTLSHQIVFRPHFHVKNIQLQNDGKLNLRVQQTAGLMKNSSNSQNDSDTTSNDSKSTVASRPQILDMYSNIPCNIVVFAFGATGSPQLTGLEAQLKGMSCVPSSAFLQDTTCIDVYRHLNKFKKKHVVIVGSGHSAFAAVDLLLNGPKLFVKDELEDQLVTSNNSSLSQSLQQAQSQFAYKRKTYQCSNCKDQNHSRLGSPKSESYKPSPVSTADKFKDKNDKVIAKGNLNDKDKEKDKVKPTISRKVHRCECFGSIAANFFEWKHVSMNKPEFEIGEIIIAHCQEIVPFFESEAAAMQVGFTRFKDAVNRNPQTLKAHHRNIFFDIIEGFEKRVKLLPYKSNEELLKIIGENPTLIINAGDLEARELSIKDLRGQSMELLKNDGNLIRVDEQGRVITKANICIRNAYGIGDSFTTSSSINSANGEFLPSKMSESYLTAVRSLKETDPFANVHDSIDPLQDAETYYKVHHNQGSHNNSNRKR